MDDIQEVTGTVWAVFGHRFAIEGAQGRFLADLGPKGAEAASLKVGDAVLLKGTHKPSEIKVASITWADGRVQAVEWPEKPSPEKNGHHTPADPALALAAVRAQGYVVESEPARKPRHFEVVGAKDGRRCAIHVDLDGTIRKTTPIQS
jgi:hypothetical protein